MKKPLQLRNLGIGIATILTVIIIPSLRFLPGQVLQLTLKYQESINIPARENVLFSCDTRHSFAFNTNDVHHKFWLYEYTGTETSDPASFTGRMFVWDGSKNLMEEIDFNRVIFTIREGKTYYIQSDEPMTYTCGEYLENGLHNNDPNGSSSRSSMQSSSARYSASEIDAACVVVGSTGRAPGEYNQSLQLLGESKHSQRAMECMMRFWAARTHNKNFVVILKEAIEQYGHSELASVLQSITGSTDPNIRANAAHLLMFFSGDSVVSTLDTLRSEDPSALVRYFATMSNYRIAGTTLPEAHRRAMVELELSDVEPIVNYLYRQGIQNHEIDALLYIENSPLVRIEIKNIIKRIVADFYRSRASASSQTSSDNKPNLSIRKSIDATRSSLVKGGFVTYRIMIENEGNAPATSVIVYQQIPTGLTHYPLIYTNNECEEQGGQIVCRNDALSDVTGSALNPGESWTVYIRYAIPETYQGTSCPATLWSTARVETRDQESNTRDNEMHADATVACAGNSSGGSQSSTRNMPNLEIIQGIDTDNSSHYRGGHIIYRLIARNTGSGTAHLVRMQHQFPSGLIYQPTGTDGCMLQGSSVLCTKGYETNAPESELQSNTSWSVSLRYAIPESYQGTSCPMAFWSTARVETNSQETTVADNIRQLDISVNCSRNSSGGSQMSSQTSSAGMTVSSACTILQTGTPSTAITQAIDFLYNTAIPGTGETCISAFVMKPGTAKEHILHIIQKMKNVDLVLTTTNLISLLTHQEPEVRTSAADALTNRIASNVTDALMLRFSAEGNDTVRASILIALQARQGSAITDLIAGKLENQRYANLHLQIVQVLGTRYDDRSKQHLRHYLSVSTSVPFTLKQAIIAVLAEKSKEDMFATQLLVDTALAGSNVDDFVRKAAVRTLGSRAPAPGVCEALVQKSIFDVNSTIRDDAVAQYLQYAEMCKHPEDDCGDRLIMSGDSRLIEMQFDRYRAQLRTNPNDMDAQQCMFSIIKFADDELQWDARAKALFDLAEIDSPITFEALSFVIMNDPYEFNRRSAAAAMADRLPDANAREALTYMKDNDSSPQLRAYALSLLVSANPTSSSSSITLPSSQPSSVAQNETVLSISNSVYAPTVIQKGNYIQYLVTVRNTSQTPAFKVQIKEEIPAGMTVDLSHTATNVCDVVKNEIICTKETPLSANAYWGVYIAYKIPTYNGLDVCPDIVSTAIVSTSTNVSQNSVLEATSVTSLDCHSSAARPDMTVTYTQTSAGNSQKGGFTQYLVRATNEGTVQAEGVKITAEIPPGLEWDRQHTSADVCVTLPEPLDRRIECTKQGVLAAGQSWGLYLSFSIPATYGGNACNTNVISGVRVSNTLLESDGSNNSAIQTMVIQCPAQSSVPTTSKPDLITSIIVSTDSKVEKGGFIQYIVHAENIGNAPAEQVKVSFNIPNGMTFTGSLSNSVCIALPSPLQNRIECTIDVINPNSIRAPTIGVHIPATFGGIACPAASTATVNVSTLTPESNAANNSSFIRVDIPCATQSSSTPVVQPSKPDLTASINLLPTSGGYNGGMANYEVVVSNAGANAAANVKVSFTIPNGLQYDEDYSSKKECKQLKEPLSQRIECERKEPLQAGATWSVQIGARIPHNFGEASCPNNVTATTQVSSPTLESNAANNSASNVLSIQCAPTKGPLIPGLDIAVSNSYYSANSQSVSGGYHMYLIRASNVGRVTASGIVITTVIPSYYTFEPILAASSPCTVVATDKLECQYNAQIQPGKYWGVYARFKIKPEACQPTMGLSAYARSLSGSEENERNNFQNANSATVECARTLQGSLLGSVLKNAESLGTPILAPSIVEILINIVRRLMGM